jgi:hypothetical protein
MHNGEINAYWRRNSRYYREPRAPEDIAEQRRLYEQAQVIGKWEKSHSGSDIQRLTWWNSDFGSFVPSDCVTPERLTEKYNEIRRKETDRMETLPSKEALERLREKYPAGTRIELLSMSDPYSTLKPGDCGFVSMVDDTGTIFADWDSGSTLGLVYGVDGCRRVAEPIHEKETDRRPVTAEIYEAAETPEPSESERSFAAWMAVTESSRYRWTEDEIYRLNGRGAMYYTGGEDGVYMRIRKDGALEAGNYEGAIPHIGEAVFMPVVNKRFGSFSEAYKAAMEAGGKRFMVDMFSGADPQPPVKITGAPEEKPSVLKQIRATREAPKPPHAEKLPKQRKRKSDIER